MRSTTLPLRNNPDAEDHIAHLLAAWRGAEDVHLMALANLHGEYADVRTTDGVLAALH